MFGATAIEMRLPRGGVVAPTDLRRMSMLRAGQYRGQIGMAHHTGGAMTGRAIRQAHAVGAVGQAFSRAGMSGAVHGLGTTLSASASGSSDSTSDYSWIGELGQAAGSIIGAFNNGDSSAPAPSSSNPDQYYQQALASQQAMMQQMMLQQQQALAQQQAARSQQTDWKPWLIGGGIVVGGLVALKVLKII